MGCPEELWVTVEDEVQEVENVFLAPLDRLTWGLCSSLAGEQQSHSVPQSWHRFNRGSHRTRECLLDRMKWWSMERWARPEMKASPDIPWSRYSLAQEQLDGLSIWIPWTYQRTLMWTWRRLSFCLSGGKRNWNYIKLFKSKDSCHSCTPELIDLDLESYFLGWLIRECPARGPPIFFLKPLVLCLFFFFNISF